MKRISSPADLEAMIDRAVALKAKRHNRANDLSLLAAQIYKRADIDHYFNAKEYRRESDKLRKMNMATTKRINRYSHKLAELRTMVLPGVVTDESVGV